MSTKSGAAWTLLACGVLLASAAASAQAPTYSIRFLTLYATSSAVQPSTCTEQLAQRMTKLGWKVIKKEVTAETGTLLMDARSGVLVSAFCSAQSRHVYVTAVNPTRNDGSAAAALNKFDKTR